MRFRFYNGDALIGYSQLEHDDRSMGIRIGRFYPESGYAPIEPIFREFTMVRFEEHLESQASGDRGKTQELRARRERLQERVATFELRLETENGRLIRTSWIGIQDASEQLGEHEREVTICVDDYQTYVEFFS